MPSLDEKVDNAISATAALIKFLEHRQEFGWADRFYPILHALKSYELDQAIRLYKSIPMPNMGGFLDLVISEQNGHNVKDYEKDNKLLGECHGAVSKSIGNIRVYIQYELDHPLVEVPDVT